MDKINIVVNKATDRVEMVETVDTKSQVLLMPWLELKEQVAFDHAITFSSIQAAANLALIVANRCQSWNRIKNG